VPVLFLTARDAVDDRVAGLRLGGDDYVTKRSASKRSSSGSTRCCGGPARRGAARCITRIADLELNEREYIGPQGGQGGDGLSPTEFKLLQCLVHNAGGCCSKNQLLEAVWSYDFNGETGIVETYISYLRRKVDSGEPRLIHTVRGFGYVLRHPSTAMTRTESRLGRLPSGASCPRRFAGSWPRCRCGMLLVALPGRAVATAMPAAGSPPPHSCATTWCPKVDEKLKQAAFRSGAPRYSSARISRSPGRAGRRGPGFGGDFIVLERNAGGLVNPEYRKHQRFGLAANCPGSRQDRTTRPSPLTRSHRRHLAM